MTKVSLCKSVALRFSGKVVCAVHGIGRIYIQYLAVDSHFDLGETGHRGLLTFKARMAQVLVVVIIGTRETGTATVT